MANNLPLGAEKDPRAPWNVKDLCRYCDADTIREQAYEAAKKECDEGEEPDDSVVRNLEDLYLSEASICKPCYKEQLSDEDE